MSEGPVARVLVDSPLPQLDQLFDYRVPAAMAAEAVVGARVRVPLRTGGRIAQGWIVELVETSEYEGRLSEVEQVVGAVGLLRPAVYELARRAADRAAGTASDVVRLAIPSRYVRAEKAWLAGHPEPGPLPAPAADGGPAVTGYAPGAVEAALAAGERMTLAAIPAPVALPDGRWVGAWALTLAQAAAATLANDRTALIIVPDARDQAQVEAALETLVDPSRVLRTDARQSGADRYRSFLAATEPHARILVGNRSTVYAPAERLGLIAIWDDGDALHREPLAPGIHARDAALLRQELTGSALLFLGHTRTVEVQRLVEVGWVRAIPRERATKPHVILTAHQGDADDPREHARIPSGAWKAASDALREGPVLVQVAQPGYAPLVVCGDCREAAHCLRCGGTLALPTAGRAPQCRLCGAGAGGWKCQNCGGAKLVPAGAGSARTAEELGRAFPNVRIVRSDGERTIEHVDASPRLVVATRGAEPVAAGGYRAVLLLDGERMLLRESLRVAEDCLRWWSNAAALAAPGAPVALVGVGGALGTTLATWRHDRWVAAELAARRELRFPPAVRAVSLEALPETLTEVLERLQAGDAGAVIDVLGPSPVDEGRLRAIVRVDYGHGALLARAVRAELVRLATERRKPVAGRPPQRARKLRVRFDDPEVP
ncbi:primosomal protein N' [Agromyces seonyuensis]|nr:primosomal protein N' [Agromyces seonyuensis]